MVKAMTMTHSNTLQPDQIHDFLLSSIQEHADVVVSFTRRDKWHLYHSQICEFNEDFVILKGGNADKLIINQPVGMCVRLGHFKYLFETSVRSIEGAEEGGRVFLDFPDKVEQLRRRTFERQQVPANLKVKCLFWHRGYLDDSQTEPAEQYWQGRLLNLSAGGAQIAVDQDLRSHFSKGQLVGVQFTPMSYQRPLLLEAHVKYLIDQPGHEQFLVGVEFLGLESGPEGREVLHRLVRVVQDYEKMNRSDSGNSAVAS